MLCWSMASVTFSSGHHCLAAGYSGHAAGALLVPSGKSVLAFSDRGAEDGGRSYSGTSAARMELCC